MQTVINLATIAVMTLAAFLLGAGTYDALKMFEHFATALGAN